MRRLILALTLVVVWTGGKRSEASAVFFADSSNSNHGSRLWDLGDGTGTTSRLIGEIASSHVNAMDFTHDGRLYGTGNGALYAISLDTGQGIQIGDTGNQPFVSLAFSRNDTLYGGTGIGEIYTIDTRSGASRFFVDTPVELVSALAYTPNGRLLGFGRNWNQPSTESVFFEINTHSQTTTVLGTLAGASNLEGLDYASDGILYAWDNQSLYTVNLATRYATLVHNFGREPSGQAMAVLPSGHGRVPEPSALAVWAALSIAGMGCGWWRKRKI